MFYDPVTDLYVGDGPPRSKPERPDGTYPCTPKETTKTEPNSMRPTGDSVHIQSQAFIENAITSSRDPRVKSAYQPTSDLASPSDAAAPSATNKLYFCRCTGKWLQEPHECAEGPLGDAHIPETTGYAPWETLPEGWIKNRIMVDQSIYPEGRIPIMSDLPANWFQEMPLYDLNTNQRLGLESETETVVSGDTLPPLAAFTTPPPMPHPDHKPVSDNSSTDSSDEDYEHKPMPPSASEPGERSSGGARATRSGARRASKAVAKKKGKSRRKKNTKGKSGRSKW